MAQQWYTITEDGIYGQRQYVTGDQIPMEWAVAWGLDGAALAEGEFFSSEEQAAIGEIVPKFRPGWRSGLYYGNDTNENGTTYTTGTIFANMLYAVWVEVPDDIAIDRIGAEITTLVATKKIRLAAYAPDGERRYPGSLIVESAELGTDATGAVQDAIVASLSAGGVWLSMQGNDSTIAVRQVNQNTRTSSVGKPAIAGTNGYGALVIARTYGAFPGTFPAGAAPNASGPVINVRAV